LGLGIYVLKILAVIGGATVGGLGSGWGLRMFVRLSAQRTVPRPIMLPVRILGAVTVGMAVWTVAFHSGGSALGLGGLWGRDGGQVTDARAGSDAPMEESRPSAVRQEVPRLSAGGDNMVRVEMLGGSRVREQRFYLLEGETDPRTLPELTKAILDRRQQAHKQPLRAVEILVYEDSVAKNHSAVRNLEKWAEEQGLAVILPATKGSAP
jgi:hypothetical protein